MTAEQLVCTYRQAGKAPTRLLPNLVDIGFTVLVMVIGYAATEPGRFKQTALLWLIGAYVCLVMQEGLTGFTVGNLVAGYKTVDVWGRAPGVSAAATRTLFRLFELIPFYGLIAGAYARGTRPHQSLGDLVADVFVVRTCDLELIGNFDAVDREDTETDLDRHDVPE